MSDAEVALPRTPENRGDNRRATQLKRFHGGARQLNAPLWLIWEGAAMELNWSQWFRCESSFGLLLVPDQPGIFALAEEMVQPVGAQSRRMLAVFEIDDAEDIARALGRLFLPSSPWRTRMMESRCYLRYAIVADEQERKVAAVKLKNWLVSQMDAAAQIFDQARSHQPFIGQPARPDEPQPYQSLGEKTVAERAVDKVTGQAAFSN